ncbi:MAG: [protein-PII] uridylyltransferase [Actinomycetota bacterium]|nr:[protein-PII] uridylyltransferase [Actinomycetota bacterium]
MRRVTTPSSPELRGSAYCRDRASAVDKRLTSLFQDALDGADLSGLALMAIGGYGRAELCPGSDVDVMLLHSGKRDRKELARVAERIWYPLWDEGLKLGHAVRTRKEALSLAADDLDTATALLDVRLVAGDREIADDLSERAARQWRDRSSRWLNRLSGSVRERHSRWGEVAFLLEPDLKQGRGGLRDVHALRWAEAARRILLDSDEPTLAAAYEAVLAVRVELQRRTGKASDVLLLQEQDGVAAALGDADADVLMARLASAARAIAWTSDDTWRRIDSSLSGPRGRVASKDRQLGPGLLLREGVVELAPDADPDGDPTLVLRAAAAAAAIESRLSRPVLTRLAVAPPLPDPWPDEARRALLRLLGAGRAAIPLLEALDQAGLLTRLVPEWQPVRSRPQRNAYHRFTVDRHLYEAAAEAAALTARVERPDLLLMGAWLHDIGKGYTHDHPSGDHSIAGSEITRVLATRMGFSADDVDVLERLVRLHLLLAETAGRRDLEDPATATLVASKVGDAQTLELLHALTEADSLATGPAAWSPWKAGLVADLVERTARVLAGEAPAPNPREVLSPARRALIEQVTASGDVVVKPEGMSLVVVARDRPGLFCRVAGTLTVHGLDVLTARGWSAENGVAIEEFDVERVFGGEPDWAAVEADLRRALTDRVALDARVSERARVYAGPSRLRAAAPARTRVTVDNESSASATVVDVRAPDRIGSLYRITRAMADLNLDIRHAKVATLGHEVVDAFYVVDAAGRKVADAGALEALQRAVAEELARP